MADTLVRQNSTIASHPHRDAASDAAVEAFALERPGVAWDWMRRTGQAPIGTDWVRPQVSEAWARCVDTYNLPVGDDLAPRVRSAPPLRDHDPGQRNSRDAVITDLSLMVYNLRPLLDEGNVILLLSDCSGKVIHLLDAGLGVSAGGRNLARIGNDWCECCVGNNGIGTSSLLKEPVAFEGEEHFARALHPFATAGCPILSPEGEVSAIVGMVAERREPAKLMLGFLRVICHLLEARLFERFSSRGFLLRLRSSNGSDALIGQTSLFDGKILVSDEGRIEGINRSSLDILGYPDYGNVIGENVSVIIGAELSSLAQSANCYSVRELLVPRTTRRIQIEIFKLDDGAPRASPEAEHDTPSLRARSSCEEASVEAAPDEAWRDVVLESALQKASCFQERNISLLITGESGVGKDYLVRRLHACGPRRDKPLVAINCAATPRDLIESELFGYESDSFTGARPRGKAGKFLEADKGVLFLDEIGDMALDLQATLLRVLDSSEVVPIGSRRAIKVDVRVVAATNRRLREMVEEGSFRRDLYYRLNGVQLSLPPLRERPDRSQLIERLLRIEQDASTGQRKILSDEVRALFFRHPWPGNIREARNVLRSSIAVVEKHIIEIDDLPHDFLEEAEFDLPPQRQHSGHDQRGAWSARRHEPGQSALADWEEQAVRSALALSEGNVAKAARNLGITRATLYHKMDRYGLRGDRRATAKR